MIANHVVRCDQLHKFGSVCVLHCTVVAHTSDLLAYLQCGLRQHNVVAGAHGCGGVGRSGHGFVHVVYACALQ
jgi:hypothetical protein